MEQDMVKENPENNLYTPPLVEGDVETGDYAEAVPEPIRPSPAKRPRRH